METTFYDEIISIECVGEIETIDINVSGNNLFFANNILTHNSGISDTDPGVDAIAEAISVLHTADFAISITRTEELDKLGQILFKQQKNRFGNKTEKLRFVVGVDLDKQKLFEVNNAEQDDLMDEKVTAKLASDTKNLRSKFSKLNSGD